MKTTNKRRKNVLTATNLTDFKLNIL